MSLLTLIFAGLLALATVLLFLATAGLLLIALINFVYQLGKDNGAPRR